MRKMICGYCGGDKFKPQNPDESKCLSCGRLLEKLSEYKVIEEHESCQRCGRKLKGEKSRNIGFGRVCFKKSMKELHDKQLEIDFQEEHREG